MTDFLDDDFRRHDRARRREERQRRVRRQRRALLIAVLAIAGVIAAFVVVPRVRGKEAPGKGTRATPSATASRQDPFGGLTGESPSGSPSPSPTTTNTRKATPKPTPTQNQAAVTGLKIVQDPVPYGTARKEQMAGYCQRHYGQHTWVLQPKAIVLHYTTGSTYGPTHNYFAANTRNLGELPGVCAHFVIDKNGTVYQQLSTGIRCRHTIGLNHVAIGIEFVQEGSAGAVSQIFARTAQITAGLKLVKMLQGRYGIPTSRVYGHGTANSSPLFKDLEGWTNDHGDWNVADIARFKQKLAQL